MALGEFKSFGKSEQKNMLKSSMLLSFFMSGINTIGQHAD